MTPHPHAGEEWFEKLPLAQRVEMARQHEARRQQPRELVILERRRFRIEALQMGGVFVLFGVACCGFGLDVLFLSLALGSALGWVCSRLDLTRIPTAAVGMIAFFGSQYFLHGTAWTVLFATFPLGACCALIGWTREGRGT